MAQLDRNNSRIYELYKIFSKLFQIFYAKLDIF